MNEAIKKVKQTGKKAYELLKGLLQNEKIDSFKIGGKYQDNSRFDLVNEYECFN